MNIFDLFFKTNMLVQFTTLLLIIFSIISWSIIFNRIFILKKEQRKLKLFEDRFWAGIELSNLYKEISNRRNRLNSSERIFFVGFKEFSKLYHIKNHLPEVVTNRTLCVMHNIMNIELEMLEKNVPLIGIIGSISPYIGLFGTVLGIIHVFLELGKITTEHTGGTHIQLIAPGVAEALISTAIGLFVAIPAVMAFNYLTIQINTLSQSYNNFIEEFIAILYRQVLFSTNSTSTTVNKDNKYVVISATKKEPKISDSI
ncbi:protein TolQ [Candidatus Blochmanniella vafra str. BVAF]|uniref:Protein TolQ n=1 Tax=Blochmanniella vafra (strain BVAF) TaxID=859654 RepID=E8Q6Y4_BLOVB|nr:protein TolQ [Candidatus Blochmannia vafer]ADV33731.1 protein TolQ [Candidatus Blochmannia vafer str. BVAF]